MCSVADDEEGAEKYMIQEDAQNITPDSLCNKCKINPAEVVLRKKDLYCNDCFIASTIHKFRANFGKTKLIKPDMNVLIAHSGDEDSSTLLYLVKNGLEESVYKKLKFNPIVLHVDEGIIHRVSDEDRTIMRTRIEEQVNSFNLPIEIVNISDVMLENASESDVDERNDRIAKLFASVASLTARHDLLKKLRRKLLLSYARKHSCTHILYADTSTKLAANSLVNISLGGGLHIASDIGFSDDRDEIKILRPMRDFTSEDLYLFIKINKISYIPQKTMTDNENQYTSIQSRVKQFVNDLQQNFPATVSTVLRTSNKMENASNSTDEQCVMCQSALDNQLSACSAIQATAFSREMSNKSVLTDSLDKNCSISGKKCGCSTERAPNLAAHLCYRCQLIVKETGDVAALPPSLLRDVNVRAERQNMKSMIQDYLL